MRARLPWILLAISLVLNVAIVGGLLYGWQGDRHGRGPERAVAQLSEQLDLTADQQQQLRAMLEGVMERKRASREAPPSPQRQALVDLLAEESFAEAETQRLLDEISTERNLVWVEVSRDMHAFVSALDQEQKAAFLSMAKERGFFRDLFRGARKRRD